MTIPRLYLSRPATELPDTAVDNDEVLALVRESFQGPEVAWRDIEQTIRAVFDLCNTKLRYLEKDRKRSPGEFASRAAAACLEQNGVAPSDIDLLVYGGVARDAFEPATAAEVAGRLGATSLKGIDVTCACAGLIEALHVVAGNFAIHDEMRTALICSGELFRDWIGYDIQSLDDVMESAAGLTLGNAAAAFLVTRDRLAPGGARIVGITHKTLAEHYALCRAPVDGKFTSDSAAMFALASHVPPLIQSLLADAGWAPEDVDHYAFHQPSELMLERIFAELGARPQAGIHTHSQFGNTASTSWALALDYRLKNGTVRSGDKIVIGSGASGFTMAGATALWEC